MGSGGKAPFNPNGGVPMKKGYDPRRDGGGAKKTKHVTDMIRKMGKALAPKDLRDNEVVRQFLIENNLKGTNLDVLVARLYSLALYNGDMQAIKLIIELLTGEGAGRKNQLIINFIAPHKSDIETTDLTSDAWSVVDPPSDADLSESKIT